MSAAGKPVRSSKLRRGAPVVAAAVAGLVVAAVAGIAAAKSFTLGVAKDVKVGSKTESVATSHGAYVYVLGTETSRHVLCNGVCLKIWPIVKAGSKPTMAAGIKGRLGSFNHGGVQQLTLNGHPLYTFAEDHHKGTAAGEGIAFKPGAIWHAVVASGSSASTHTTSSSSSTSSATSSTTTSSSSTYSYPGY